jgi:hypothetical protein
MIYVIIVYITIIIYICILFIFYNCYVYIILTYGDQGKSPRRVIINMVVSLAVFNSVVILKLNNQPRTVKALFQVYMVRKCYKWGYRFHNDLLTGKWP